MDFNKVLDQAERQQIDSWLKPILAGLEKQVEDLFAGESSGHDKYHLIRVRNLALQIQAAEGGNRPVIGIAAFLHDLHRVMRKDEKSRYYTPHESLPAVARIMESVAVPADLIESVLHCVQYHEEYGFNATGKTVNDLETLIIQDADNLDAMGSIGIARGFMYAGAHGIPMYLPEVPLPLATDYNEGVHSQSEIHHFPAKLLRLKENMNTETAKGLAESRETMLLAFLIQFLAEWKNCGIACA